MKQVFQLTGLNGTLLAKRPKPEKKEEERGREREREQSKTVCSRLTATLTRPKQHCLVQPTFQPMSTPRSEEQCFVSRSCTSHSLHLCGLCSRHFIDLYTKNPRNGRIHHEISMLTPPSVHRSVVAQNASERRAVAAERREQALAAQLVQERARALECRRQQLQLAQRERETYLEQVRAFFDMASAVQGVHDKPVSLCHPSVGPGWHRAGKSCSSNERRPASVDRAAVTAVSKSQPGWSEVSTAAPSTVGEEDQVDLCTTPAEAEIGSRLSASLRAWLNRADDEADKESHLAVDSKIPEEMESSNSLQQLEVALAGEIRAGEERDPLDETLSSSEDDVAESRVLSSEMRNRPLPCSKSDSAAKPAHAQAGTNECDSSRPRRVIPATKSCKVSTQWCCYRASIDKLNEVVALVRAWHQKPARRKLLSRHHGSACGLDYFVDPGRCAVPTGQCAVAVCRRPGTPAKTVSLVGGRERQWSLCTA